MNNKEILAFMSSKAEQILQQEGTDKREVFVKLYPLLQFVERIFDVSDGLSRLFNECEKPHPCWPILMRPLMLDGLYVTYALSKLVDEQDHNELFYGMLSDGLAKIEKHANYQKDWGVITADESEALVKKFKSDFSYFFDEKGELVSGKKVINAFDLITELYKSKSFFFNPAQNFYTKYFILSKFEHYNVLNKEFRDKLEINDYIKLAYVHFMYVVDIIISIEGAKTSREMRRELVEIGTVIASEYII